MIPILLHNIPLHLSLQYNSISAPHNHLQ